MHDYKYIYPRGLYTDKEGGTTDASYPKDIFDKFPLRNWNKFLSKFFLTYFSPHVEKEPFLDASMHLYKRVCLSVRLSVRPSVRGSIRRFGSPNMCENELVTEKQCREGEAWRD